MKLITLALKNLTRNKLRSLLTILGVAILLSPVLVRTYRDFDKK